MPGKYVAFACLFSSNWFTHGNISHFLQFFKVNRSSGLLYVKLEKIFKGNIINNRRFLKNK